MIETLAVAGVILECLALNVYFEARHLPVPEQYAVAHVVLNRVESNRFPDDVCEVVYQPKQFSWYSDGKSDEPKEKKAWLEAWKIAKDVLENRPEDPTAGAIYYHAHYVDPYWSRDYLVTYKDAGHVYYVYPDRCVYIVKYSQNYEHPIPLPKIIPVPEPKHKNVQITKLNLTF